MVTFFNLSLQKVRLTNNCKENEVFTNCGSACDLTCENVTAPVARKTNSYEPYVVLDEPPCKPQYNCIPGCYCRKPLYRNRFGECVEEKECKRNFNRHDFVEELNKFLGSFTFDEHRVRQSTDAKTDEPPQSKQKYIAVNDNSESVINPRTGYQSSQSSGYQSATSPNYPNYPNLFGFNEREFFGNLFDDLFSQARNSPRQQSVYRTNYNYNNYNTANGGSINAKEPATDDVNRELEKQIEKEADIIIQQISNGLKWVLFFSPNSLWIFSP